MSHTLGRAIATGVIALGLRALVYAQQGVPFGPDLPEMPGNIAVDDGFAVFLKGHAIGTQNYVCLATPTGFAWKQFAPEATLFQTFRGEISQQVTTHFLSANPDEFGLARPTWQHAFDSSRVWAQMVQPSSDSNYVEPGAIPWLLLAVVGKQAGPTGGSTMTQTKYIQRLNTSGGAPPATGCALAANIGAIALVPYSADYFFYRKARN